MIESSLFEVVTCEALPSTQKLSGIQVVAPYLPPCDHEISNCPTCQRELTRVVQGPSVRRYFTERWGLEEAQAQRLWRLRQIMHGAVPFDSETMDASDELVQIVRAVVAAEIKLYYGLPLDGLPTVKMGAVGIRPDSLGLGGEAEITQADLDWPRPSV